MKFYSGIGSRQTPEPIMQDMTNLANWLEAQNLILRSGGAIGADKAFKHGVKNLNNRNIFKAKDVTPEAIELAKKFHPAWDACNDYVRSLHGRNAMIVLGKELDAPSEFVVCYTWNGQDVGGTGLAIRIADSYKIPIFNFYAMDIDDIRTEVNKLFLTF